MNGDETKTNLLQMPGIGPDAEVIGMLKRLLALAEQGEIVGIAVAAIYSDRAITTGFSENIPVDRACYAVTVLRLRLEDLIRGVPLEPERPLSKL